MLRNNMTLAEILLWNQLKQKRLLGYDFHRQKPIDEYVVDFFCLQLLLAIEIDGDSHEGKPEKDSQKQQDIEKFGIHFLRFPDSEVKQNLDGVLEVMCSWIEAHCSSKLQRGDEHSLMRPLSSVGQWDERGEQRGVCF